MVVLHHQYQTDTNQARSISFLRAEGVSVAGKQKGLDDIRTALVAEMMRITIQIKPNLVILENVGALRHQGLRPVVEYIFKTLSSHRYVIRWCTVKAKNVGCPMGRERVFICAFINSDTFLRFQQAPNDAGCVGGNVSDWV
jgi:site-specific DNA-cytosine methylase